MTDGFLPEKQQPPSGICVYTHNSNPVTEKALEPHSPICKTLRGKVKQYVVTNGVTAIQTRKLSLSGFADMMDGFFISEQIGVPKPHKEFFDYCLNQIPEKDKTKILIVGDSLTSDIKGGIGAGIPTCWYRKNGTINSSGLHPDFEISNLNQVFEILQ